MIKTSLLSATPLFSLLVALSPAHALSNRAWVSGHGTDAAGCGAPASPCRTFQYVHDNIVAAGGEIDVLDPAGYGPIVINKALSIVNDGVGTAGVQAASGNAIAINAGASDVVTLRGLDIDGLGTGAYGILFNSGMALTIQNSVIRHFQSAGVLFNPNASSALAITDTLVADNSLDGIYVGSGAQADFYRVQASRNAEGFAVFGDNITASADNCAAYNNTIGYDVQGASTFSLFNSIASNNFHQGLSAYGSGAILRIAHSMVTGNGVGWTVNGAVIDTYSDNYIDGNGVSVGSLTPINRQ